MKDELQSAAAKLPTDKLFISYMYLISKRESEEVYRLQEPVGEGIMKHTHIADGIELVYSELESYNPCYQSKRKSFDALEIMYIEEGHADFELENRQIASGDKGDVMIFNSQTGIRKSTLGKEEMKCISLIIFPNDAVAFLNSFLACKEFSADNFFSEIRKSNACIRFPAGELLEKLFQEMMQRPSEFSKHYLRLAVVHAILLLMHTPQKREHSDLYFSGTTGRKVQQLRKLLSANPEEDISIEELAQKIHLNRTTMQEVFKETYGLTIKAYRTQIRIQHAKQLLLTGEHSITEIAGLCGYANASKFSSVFKRNTGMLPKDWRMQIQQ